MKIVITIEVPEHVDPDMADANIITTTLMDALAEFQAVRRNAPAYVAERYPEGEDYAWLDRDKKIAEVHRRVTVAGALRHIGSIQLKPEEEI